MIRLASACLALTIASIAVGETVALVADRDTTLVEEPMGLIGHGASPHFYAGRIGHFGLGTLRRGLLHFDVAGNVPAGSTINSVELHVLGFFYVGNPEFLHLKRMLADWGEAGSYSEGGSGAEAQPGDATWLHRFYPDVFWTSPGGDFVELVSTSAFIELEGPHTFFSTPQAVADVQSWLNDPASNFGWLVQCDNEIELYSVKKLASREWLVAEERPTLVIDYSLPSEILGDVNGDSLVNGADLGLLLGAWATAASGPDLNDDGMVNGADLGLMLGAWTG